MGVFPRAFPALTWLFLVLAYPAAVLCIVNQEDPEPIAASFLPVDPPYECGENLEVSYNELPGTFLTFPNVTTISLEDYDFFGDEMDFESVPDRILIGAADKLYLMNYDLSVAEGNVLNWPPLPERVEFCEDEYEEPEERNYICRNHIRLHRPHPTDPNLLYVCGTQATDTQQCRGVPIVNGSLSGEAQTPNDTYNSIVSSHPDYPSFGEFTRANATDTNYVSWTYTADEHFLLRLNEQRINYNETTDLFSNRDLFGVKSGWFDNPLYFLDLIPASYSSLEFTPPLAPRPEDNFEFFFLFMREVHRFSLERSTEIEPMILSRVVRLCRDDPGVLLTDNRTLAFSTLLKSRIYCDQDRPRSRPRPLENPLGAVDNRYNDLWSVAMNADSGGRPDPVFRGYKRVMYAAFSAPLHAPAGSAICVYHASPSNGMDNNNRGVYDTFNEDVFVGDSNVRFENIYLACNGQGRPARTVNRVTAEDTVVVNPMIQIGENPLIVLDSLYITQMAVDEVCVVLTRDGSKCLNQDIIFAGTDDGRILKVASLQDGPITTKPLLAEDIALENGNPIKEIKIETTPSGDKFLYAATTSHVYRLELERCSRHNGLEACVGSRDPYCVWNSMLNVCQRNNLSAIMMFQGVVPPYILQNITSGVYSSLVSVEFPVPTYTVDESAEELSITLAANDTVPDGWVELQIVNSDGSVSSTYPISFSNTSFTGAVSFAGSASFTGSVSIPVPSDSVYTGVSTISMAITNTAQGSVLFTRKEASVRVIDDDGILAQVGLVALDDTCLPWRARYRFLQPPLERVDKAILKGLEQKDLVIESKGIHCSQQQALVNVAIYRFTLTGTTPTIDTAKLRDSLAAWTEKREEVKLIDGATAKVDPGCNTRILTLDDALCLFPDAPPSGVRSASGVNTPGGTAAIVLGLLLAGAIVLCAVLLVALLLVMKKNNSTHNDCEETSGKKRTSSRSVSAEHVYDGPQNHNNIASDLTAGSNYPGGNTTGGNDMTDMGQITTGEEELKKDLTASHSSSDSSHSAGSPVPVSSAAPLVHDGVESKKNPFQFPLHKAPFGRRDSPKVSTSNSPRVSRVSVDSSNARCYSHDSSSAHRNSRDDTTAF